MLSCPYADSILWPAGLFCLHKLVAHLHHVFELLPARILGDICIELFQDVVVLLQLQVDILGASSRALFNATSARSSMAALYKAMPRFKNAGAERELALTASSLAFT